MNKIYRVEDEDGVGPYGRDYNVEFLESHNCDRGKHPTPYYDPGIRRECRENEICGFLSIKQLLNWFSVNELYKLKKCGYKLKRVEVNKITAIGRFQCLAIRKWKPYDYNRLK